ncbi:MAG: Gfo/Idh/MocA family oxidoreductase [Bacteroidota bacterium]
MSHVRWGVVGTGGIAGAFARDIAHADGADLVAVGSRSDASAQRFARAHGADRAHGSYEALFADPEVDAVYVATPHTLHLDNATDALRAGKAVLCEKPLTVTPDEARRLVAVAEATGGHLTEAMWTHFLPAVQTARRWIDEGRLGEVLRVQANFGVNHGYDPESRLYDPDLAGGVLLDMGVYPVSLAWFVLRQHPEAVSAWGHRAPTGVEDDVVMRFDYPEGVVATLSASFRGWLSNDAWVVGTEGTVHIPDFFRARSCTLLDGETTVETFTDDRAGLGYEYEILAVSDDIRAGRPQSAVVPWEASLAFQDHMARVFDEIGGRLPTPSAFPLTDG